MRAALLALALACAPPPPSHARGGHSGPVDPPCAYFLGRIVCVWVEVAKPAPAGN